MATPTKVYSVQPRFTRGAAQQVGGWAWIDYLFRSYRKSNLPAYGTWQRDVYLAECWKGEPIQAGVYNAFIERVQTRQWKCTGGRNNASSAARMLNDCEGGEGLSLLLGLSAGDFIFTDKGVMIEKGRHRPAAILGPVLSLQHIDATRMVVNYDLSPAGRRSRDKGRWVYLPEVGEPIPVPDENLIHIIPTPSGRDRFRGFGYCVTSRLFDAMELMIGLLIYYRQKIGNLPPQLIAILNGMSEEQFKAAYQAYEAERRMKDSDVYPGVFFLGSDDPGNPVTLNTTQFAGLPDGFDWMPMQEWWVKLVALNIGEASGDYWLLQHAGIGQAGYAVQAQMARGRGSGRFMYEIEYKLNTEVMPNDVRFSFDAPNDEQDKERADILAVNMASIERMARVGVERGEPVFSIDEIRQTAIELDVLDAQIAGEDVPAELGAMLKRYAGGVTEPLVHVTNEYEIVEVQPVFTGKTADKARALYHLLEGYYVPRLSHGGNGGGEVAAVESLPDPQVLEG